MPFVREPYTEEEFRSSACLICQCDGDEHLQTVTDRGLPTLMNACRVRSWTILESLLALPEQFVIHSSCRKRFTRLTDVGQYDCDGAACIEQKQLRSSAAFDWKHLCFFCKETVAFETDSSTAKSARRAGTLELRSSVLRHCMDRADDWAIEVRGRLEACCDLVAEEAVYHCTCYALFTTKRNLSAQRRPGRPEDVKLSKAFDDLCEWLEGSCELLTLDDLRQYMLQYFTDTGLVHMSDAAYSTKHLKLKLQERYGQHIYFAEMRGRKNVVCFHDLCSFIITNEWQAHQTRNDDSEKDRFVKSAAKVILAEIREMHCDMDTYPSIVCEDSYHSSFLPPLLQTFLTCVTSNPLKRSALGQCLVQAARPRTMLAPLLLGLAVELDHLYGSSSLITHLSRFGFCLSYDEVTRYKQSIIMSQIPGCPGTSPYPAAVTQWVGDNIDHNLQTLDGKGTFHGMGLISVSVPLKGNYTSSPHIANFSRLKSKLPVSQLLTNRGLPIVHYNKPGRCGLVEITMREISHLTQSVTVPLLPISSLDTLWHLKWFFKSDDSPRPNWAGYMQATCTGEHQAAGAVNMLPMVDLKPTDASCIYSTLLFVVQQAKQLQLPAAVITFDQQLWIKAVDIAAATGLDIVCRLGGFHIIKSFLGAIGTVMAGSGLEELLGTVYGPDTVVAMLNGHAVSRAVRGHLLVQGALVVKLLQTIPDIDLGEIDKLITDVDTRKVDSADCSLLDDESLKQIEAALNDIKTKLTAASRTAKLWTRYIDYVQVLKLFLLAERTSNWHLHLKCIHDMLNLFAATGHNNYYKSCRLYLQLMLNLPNSHPWLHEMFASCGLHSVRRTEGRYWGGLSMDLIIEQCLMKSIKGQGGLTRGRGMSESVRAVWVATMHQLAGSVLFPCFS